VTIAQDMASADAMAPQMIPVGIDLSPFAQRLGAAEGRATKTLPTADTEPSTEE